MSHEPMSDEPMSVEPGQPGPAVDLGEPQPADPDLDLGAYGEPPAPTPPPTPRRRPLTRATAVVLVTLAVAAGLIAGFEEGGRRLERRALAATTVLAWVTGFDGTGATVGPPGRHALVLHLHLATTGHLPLTLSALTLAGRPVDLSGPVALVPGRVTAAAGLTEVACGSAARDGGTVRTGDGHTYRVGVRKIDSWLDAVIAAGACARA